MSDQDGLHLGGAEVTQDVRSKQRSHLENNTQTTLTIHMREYNKYKQQHIWSSVTDESADTRPVPGCFQKLAHRDFVNGLES